MGEYDKTYQVISQELHDQGGVFVALLAEGIKFYIAVRIRSSAMIVSKLTSNGVIKGLLGEVACLIGRVQDLIVEDGEVEGETKADWVCWCKICLSNLGSVLVGFERFVG